MTSFRVPALRYTVSGAAPYMRATQRRWAQVHDVRFLATQPSDRILKKYKEKLDRKAKEYDMTSCDCDCASDCSIGKGCAISTS